MELKNFFVQDAMGNVVRSPKVYVYQPGTTTLATGLKNVAGGDLANPFDGNAQGQVAFRAPDGEYDLRAVGSGRDFTMRVRFIDAVAYADQVTAAKDRKNHTGVQEIGTVDGLPAALSDRPTAEDLVGGDGDGLGFKQPDPEARRRPMQAKGGDIINVRDFYDATDPDFTNAIERALYRSFPKRRSIRAIIPNGVYYVSRQIVPARQVCIRGETELGTVLHFRNVASINPVMDGAFVFATAERLAESDPAYSGKAKGTDSPFGNGNVYTDFSLFGGGEYSSLESLSVFRGEGSAAALKYAVWNGVRLHMSQVQCLQIGAVKTEAGNLIIRQGVTLGGNANYSMFSRVTSRYAPEHAFSTDGDDANAIQFVGCNGFGAAVNQFLDGTLLGNSYLACHADGGQVEYKSINPSNASRTSFIGCYAEGRNGNVPWEIAAGHVIIMPQGAQPQPLSGARNTTLAGAALRGMAINTALNFSANFDGFGMGDATHPFARVIPGGMFLRGQGDGHFYGLVAQGQGVNAGGSTGASVMKTLNGSGDNLELIHLGDPRNRPSFGRGFIANLPVFADNASALAGGLTAGEAYRTAAGDLKVVI